MHLLIQLPLSLHAINDQLLGSSHQHQRPEVGLEEAACFKLSTKS
jgi:hypothetical protein